MNKIFRTSIVCAALVLCGVAAKPMLAQGGGGGGRGMNADTQLQRIDAAVTLTADQKPKVKAILDASVAKMQALMQAQDPDARTKMTDIRTQQNKDIRALLTPDQQTKFDAMPQGRRGGGGGGGGGNQ